MPYLGCERLFITIVIVVPHDIVVTQKISNHMNLEKRFWSFTFVSLLGLCAIVPVRAQEKEKKDEGEKSAAVVAEKKSVPEVAKEKEPVLSVTEHEITLGGKVIKYKATTGYLTLKDAKDKVKANVFFVAYTKEDEPDPSKRPITFSFNGGPGSASIWLHMGALGPKRVLMTDKGESLPPPYKLVDNEYCWLDQTDLVFIDPVSTGYSRAAAGEDPKQFHGYKQDLAEVGDFIRLYTTRNARWTSPKFIVGESYGTTRAAGLSDYLQSRYGYYLNGIMLVSSILNFQTARFAPGNDLPYELFLPTYTAAAWYHGKLDKSWAKDLPTALKEVENFVNKDYIAALNAGDALPPAERARVVQQLAKLTSLPATFLEQRNMRIDIFTFTHKLLESEDRSVGRYDSRIKGIRYQPGSDRPDFDPSYEAVYGGYVTGFNDYVRRTLKYENDLPYEALTGEVQPWDYSNVQNEYLNVAESLHQAMSRNPFLKVWIASGYYDLATPYFATNYTVHHMNLDPTVRSNITQTYYDAGHMVYMNPASLAQLKQDFSKFIQTTLSGAK